jgi:SAM-dependent methyltransferase
MDRERWNERYREHTAAEPGPANPVLERVIDSLPPGSALDIAAGTGRNAIFLARRGWKVTAVDFSDVAVERGRRFTEQEGLPVTWVAQDLSSYFPRREAFDLVCLCYLHMPWEELRTLFERAAAALTAGGRFLAVGHDIRNLEEGVGGPPYPEILYTPQRLSAALEPYLHITYARSEVHSVDHGDAHSGSAGSRPQEAGEQPDAGASSGPSEDAPKQVDTVVLAVKP